MIEVKSPAEWTEHVREDFEVLALAAGKVDARGLPARIAEARSLACYFDEGQLVAIAALKVPRPAYRKKVSNLAGFQVTEGKYPYEVGWLHVTEKYQGRGLSRPLVDACLAAAAGRGVFATTGLKNIPMQNTLNRTGFVEVGSRYDSNQDDGPLLLFVREGSTAE